MLAGDVTKLALLANILISAAVIVLLIQAAARQRVEIKNQKDLMQDLVKKDHLTGANSRRELDRLIGDSNSVLYNSVQCFIYIDLYKFRRVNESYGVAIGDDVIQIVAQRLSGTTKKQDLLYRVGGDQFLLVLCSEDSLNPEFCCAIGDRLVKAVSTPISIGVEQLILWASVGIGCRQDVESCLDEISRWSRLSLPERMYEASESAMRDAKRLLFGRDGNSIVRWSKDVQSRQCRAEVLAYALKKILTIDQSSDELYVVAQPIVELGNGKIHHFEILSRWNSSLFGPVSPGEFIAIAEAENLIGLLSIRVLQIAISTLRLWLDVGIEAKFAVNIPPSEISHPALAVELAHFLKEFDVSPDQIILELTETEYVGDVPAYVADLQRFNVAHQRIQLETDDFGTGYASLGRWKAFPTNIKVDGCLIPKSAEDLQSIAICEAIKALATIGGVALVAEQLETAEQVELMCKLGYDYGQGYALSRPVPLDEAKSLMIQGSLRCNLD